MAKSGKNRTGTGAAERKQAGFAVETFVPGPVLKKAGLLAALTRLQADEKGRREHGWVLEDRLARLVEETLKASWLLPQVRELLAALEQEGRVCRRKPQPWHARLDPPLEHWRTADYAEPLRCFAEVNR